MSRPPRQAQVATERRRRSNGTLDRTAHLKLAVPDIIREKHADKSLRWINDTPGRMYAMTKQDDWDVIDDVPAVPVGTDEAGQPIYARLCGKPKQFWEQDQREKAAQARDHMKAVVRKGDDKQPSSDGSTYVTPGNTVETKGYEP